jgi:osmotically-inducible protein OsmY
MSATPVRRRRAAGGSARIRRPAVPPAIRHRRRPRPQWTSAGSGLIGVRNVRNEIAINVDADPGDVTVLVQDALDRSALMVDDSEVLIDSAGNTVTLTGRVRTWAEHDAVIDATWMASGVYDVIDDLAITG